MGAAEEEELLLRGFELPVTTKRSALIHVAPSTDVQLLDNLDNTAASMLRPVSERSACIQTPMKRIGNITFNTIKRSNLVDNQQPQTPLCRLGPGTSPMKVGASRPLVPRDCEDNKENVCPAPYPLAGRKEYQFGQVFSSPIVSRPAPSITLPTPRPMMPNVAPKKTEWDALDDIIKQSRIESNPSPRPAPSVAIQSEADEIESLLFSQDPGMDFCAGGPDIFLGYDYDFGASETESVFRGGRPRSSSMISVQTVRSMPSRRAKIEVKVRSCKKELPSLKSSSQLRKMILPGSSPHLGKRTLDTELSENEETERPKEYASFIHKLTADEPVESDISDDEFKDVGEEPLDEEEDYPAIKEESLIPRKEIEFLFEDSKDLSIGSRSLLINSPERIPSQEELENRLLEQIQRHFVFLVQMLALCGELQGTDDKHILLLKMIAQLGEQLPENLVPRGLKEGLEFVLASIADPIIRDSLSGIKKTDPILRPKSSIKPLCPVIFKHGTPEDPCHVSDGYHGMLLIFKVTPKPSDTFNISASTLVDNTADSKKPLNDKRRNECFLKSEDGLLLVGLKKFGLGNWEMIQARFLPTRTSKQLCVRYKNLVARRAPSNPIKDFVQELWSPLSKAEEDLIYRGVLRFGKDFKQISSHYLPHRPPTILKNLWEQMDESRRHFNANNPTITRSDGT